VLCNQHVLGSSAAQDRIEIAFTLYATTAPTADVIRFYATAHEQTVAPDATTVAVKLENAHKVLRVVRAVDHYPECGVDPRPDEPTVIIVSELTSG
jgi:hypothetical protein